MAVLPGAVVGNLLQRLAAERRRVVLDGFGAHDGEWSGRWSAGERAAGSARAAAAEVEVLERLAEDASSARPADAGAADVVLALTMAIRREPDRAAIILDAMLTDHPRLAVVIVATALRMAPGLRREILAQARRHQPFSRHPFILGLLLALVAKVLADNTAEAAEDFAGVESPAEIVAALGRHVAGRSTGGGDDRGGGRAGGYGPIVAAPFVAAVLSAGDAWSRTDSSEAGPATGAEPTSGRGAAAAEPSAHAVPDPGPPSDAVAPDKLPRARAAADLPERLDEVPSDPAVTARPPVAIAATAADVVAAADTGRTMLAEMPAGPANAAAPDGAGAAAALVSERLLRDLFQSDEGVDSAAAMSLLLADLTASLAGGSSVAGAAADLPATEPPEAVPAASQADLSPAPLRSPVGELADPTPAGTEPPSGPLALAAAEPEAVLDLGPGPETAVGLALAILDDGSVAETGTVIEAHIAATVDLELSAGALLLGGGGSLLDASLDVAIAALDDALLLAASAEVDLSLTDGPVAAFVSLGTRAGSLEAGATVEAELSPEAAALAVELDAAAGQVVVAAGLTASVRPEAAAFDAAATLDAGPLEAAASVVLGGPDEAVAAEIAVSATVSAEVSLLAPPDLGELASALDLAGLVAAELLLADDELAIDLALLPAPPPIVEDLSDTAQTLMGGLVGLAEEPPVPAPPPVPSILYSLGGIFG